MHIGPIWEPSAEHRLTERQTASLLLLLSNRFFYYFLSVPLGEEPMDPCLRVEAKYENVGFVTVTLTDRDLACSQQ